MITVSKQISEHFHSSEFRCPHCGNIKIDEGLVNKLEHIFSKLNASKCIISSGYRCREYDIRENGFAGRHSEGLAADCVFYDKNNNIIPSKIVICVAYDLRELNGIANIDGNYTHLDNRQGSTYRGDEQRGNSSYWTNPYSYFGVSRADADRYTGQQSEQQTCNGAQNSEQQVNVFYSVKTKAHGVLAEVKNLTDYAGYQGSPITAIAMRVDKGSIKYRVHLLNGGWLPWVTGCDWRDFNNVYAGDGEHAIDAVEAYYYTPDGIRPYKRIKYRVNDYAWQYDNETSNGQDGYGGAFGVVATKFQAVIE